jgi:prepilin-type processing-associated H-X9-DG protein
MGKMKSFLILTLKVVALLGGAVLAFGILFGMLAGREPYARQSACMFNMRQVGLGFEQYTQDYDGKMPNIEFSKDGKDTWRTETYPYVKSTALYACPTSSIVLASDGYSESYGANYTGNYSGRADDKGHGALAGLEANPVAVGDFSDPGKTIVLCEIRDSNRPEFNIDNAQMFPNGAQVLNAPHDGKGSYLMADGHARSLAPAETSHLWYRNPTIPLSRHGTGTLAATSKYFSPFRYLP